ncbi:hypothetical protein X728_28920 [Mesorhizobium sp. L103C120A0]|nr:hypothetical protein X728_28920 [Mesorhizobium sp. L103C120A0]
MSFELRPTSELVKIVSVGGGLVIDASLRPTLDLIQLAAAAKQSGARLFIRGMKLRQTADMMQIAAAGGGMVQFSGDDKPGA